MSIVEDLLLSWERERAGERTLTASVLQARGNWTEKATEILAVVGGVEGRLSWLGELIAASEDSLLCRDGNQWLAILLHHLKDARDPAPLQCVCRTVSALLTRIQLSPQVLKELPSRYLPSLLSSLLRFAHGGVATQCTVLPVIARLLYLFPDTHMKEPTPASLKKWANKGLLSESVQLSQECSRLLVILYSEQRSDLLHSVVSGLRWALSQLYQPVLGGGREGGGSVGSLSLPPTPKQEPHRSGFLLRLVTALERTLVYCLTFTLGHAGTFVAVPVARVLGVVFLGLAVQQHQVTGQSTEVLLLGGFLQVLHTAVWNILTATIKCCSSHLLPYCATIDACLLRGLTSGKTPLAVHRALCAWVAERRDCGHFFAAAVLTTLLDTTSADVMAVQLSGVKVMITVVKSAGPSLHTPVAQSVWKFPLGQLSSSRPPPPSLIIALLELLLVCATSTVPSLTPPLPKTLQIFTAHCIHPSIEVRKLGREGLDQLSLIQHPIALPLLTALHPHPPIVHPPITHPPITHPPITHSTAPHENHPPITHPPITHPPITHPPITHPPITHPPITHPTAPHENHPPITHPPITHPTAPHESHNSATADSTGDTVEIPEQMLDLSTGVDMAEESDSDDCIAMFVDSAPDK